MYRDYRKRGRNFDTPQLVFNVKAEEYAFVPQSIDP